MARFLPLILVIVSMYGGCQLFEINKGKATDQLKNDKQQLCENGVKTTATLQNEYTEMEVGSSVSYQYKYDYVVDGVTYTGNLSKKEELEIPLVEITYNPKFPDQSTTTDPCAAYAKIKDMAAPWPEWIEYIGAGLFILGLLFLKGSAVRAITGR